MRYVDVLITHVIFSGPLSNIRSLYDSNNTEYVIGKNCFYLGINNSSGVPYFRNYMQLAVNAGYGVFVGRMRLVR